MPYTYTRYSVPQITVGCIRWRFPEKTGEPKFDAGSPKDNILFQAPDRAIIWQNGAEVLDQDLSKPENLVRTLRVFFGHQPPAFEQWQQALDERHTKFRMMPSVPRAGASAVSVSAPLPGSRSLPLAVRTTSSRSWCAADLAAGPR
jgi:hypothetical protein